MNQNYWEDVEVGQEITPATFPLTIYRLVMTAGANRDFNAIHHNSDYARNTGAPDMYANTLFLLGMWERTVRDFIGLGGTIRQIQGFRMKAFNTVGNTVTVKGCVQLKSQENDDIRDKTGLVEIKLWSETLQGITVGPGMVVVTLPLRATAYPQKT